MDAISCNSQKRALQRIYDCIETGVPKDEILAQLNRCIEDPKTQDHQKILALTVQMQMSGLYWERQEEMDTSLKKRSSDSSKVPSPSSQ